MQHGLGARGEHVFVTSGCAVCHADGGRGTDARTHRLDAGGAFLTPSLVGLGRSAPYFHDGRFASLDEVLRATDGRMGRTGALSAADRAALLAYLASL